jgi:hypothetical protein
MRIESQQSTPEVNIGTFRVGYGHIRGALAIADALSELEINHHITDLASNDYHSPVKPFLHALDITLGYLYRNVPDLFIKASQGGPNSKVAETTMNVINDIAGMLDFGIYGRSFHPDTKVAVASHVTAADLLTQFPHIPTFLLGLDPYAHLYNTRNPTAITSVPDLATAQELTNIGTRDIVVTGPIVAKPIAEAKSRCNDRLKELQNGAGLKITVATGGSLSHGDEIIGLSMAYINKMTQDPSKIEKLNIVIGDSDNPKRGGNMKGQLETLLQYVPEEVRNNIQIIYNTDPIALVREADTAMGESDVIHAKTGELVYAVGGGKVFETFGKNPSLGPQELKLREYVENKARHPHDNSICALEQGEMNVFAEIDKIMQQFEDGTLLKRMEAGLQIPTTGADCVAGMIQRKLEKLKKIVVPL